MKTWKRMLLTSVAYCLAFDAVLAGATPITYEFVVTATEGPLSGVSSSGTFTFDSTIVPAGGGKVSGTLFTDLEFSWDGIDYDETTANTGAITFNAAGSIERIFFGVYCGDSGCSVFTGQQDFLVALPNTVSFLYTSSDNRPGVFAGTASISLVPEPATLALLGLGLAGLAFSRRRQ